MGLYTTKANSLGALLAIIFGAAGWQFVELYIVDPTIPATLVGLGLSFAGMFIGILAEAHIHKIVGRFSKTA